MTFKSPAARRASIVLPMALATVVLSAQSAQRPTPPPSQTTQQPVFRVTADYVSTDVHVKDAKGVFVPGLGIGDFEVFEDGVRQKVLNFFPYIGGRPMNAIIGGSIPVPALTEGLILPKQKPKTDTSGRIFIIFVDDMSFEAQDSPIVRNIMEQIRDTVLHDNDLIGIVSSGYSSIQIDLVYDYEHKRMNEAIEQTMGSAMSPDDIIEASRTAEGPVGLRFQVHVAMRTAHDILQRAAEVTDRRKAFLYISNGYDFDPFQDARLKYVQDQYGPPTPSDNKTMGYEAPVDTNKYGDPFAKPGQLFAEGDLINDLAELIRDANRASMTFYTISPRGLTTPLASNGTRNPIFANDWLKHVQITENSLRALSDNTGGFCICATNGYKAGLERIDNETSDYYILGYNSTNPDPFHMIRKVEIRVKRPGVTLDYRKVYTLPRPKKGKG
jgi:VWFA-related protein